MAKLKKNDTTGANADIAAAKRIDADIERKANEWETMRLQTRR
jgi:hypothetical protein